MKKIFEAKVSYLASFLNGYKESEIFLTTSLNKDSAIILSLMEEAGLKGNVYFVNTGLIDGDWKYNLELLEERFDHNFYEINAVKKRDQLTNGQDFFSLQESKRKKICKDLKKKTLFDSLKESNYKIWINGIRKIEPTSRESMKAISISNGYIKFSPIFDLTDLDIYFIQRYRNLGYLKPLIDHCKQNALNECGLHIE